jgi:lipopolysaccharide transport system ATP-binding protein
LPKGRTTNINPELIEGSLSKGQTKNIHPELVEGKNNEQQTLTLSLSKGQTSNQTMTVIKVDQLSKMYDLGRVGTGTLYKDLNRTWAKLLGRPDPYATLAELNDRTQKSSSGSVWALKDISFEVQQGDVLGIIGKNGAGKSTLLKILSQITTPTSGDVKIKGRVASLLEVGTGMHPEMTARENIYLNGAIMGMTRHEITRKLDEIVDFAGIGKYVDTPIKRFSSGMKVRLGFAVAAFLEPEILIVDEVLAVGDAEFQKKAIGKMQDVSKGEGRTVLFVSHNMAAVKSLCTKGLMLENGTFKMQDEILKVIDEYQKTSFETSLLKDYSSDVQNAPGNENISVLKVALESENPSDKFFTVETNLTFSLTFKCNHSYKLLHNTLSVINMEDNVIFSVVNQPSEVAPGIYKAICKIPGNLLNYGRYRIKIHFVKDELTPVFVYDGAVVFDVEDKKREINYFGPWHGFVRPKLDFTLVKAE